MITALSAWLIEESAVVAVGERGHPDCHGFRRRRQRLELTCSTPSLEGLPGARISLLRALGMCCASIVARGGNELRGHGEAAGVFF
jgi:hypothetical protein